MMSVDSTPSRLRGAGEEPRRRELAPPPGAPSRRARRGAALASLGAWLVTMAGCAEIVGISPTEADDGRVGAGGGLGLAGERALGSGALAGSETGTAGEQGVTGARGGDDESATGSASTRGGASATGGSVTTTGGALVTGGRVEPPGGGASAGDAGTPVHDPDPTGGAPVTSGGTGAYAGEPAAAGGASAGDGGAPAPDSDPTGGAPVTSGGTGAYTGDPKGGGGAGTSAGAAGGEEGGAEAGAGGTAGGLPAVCDVGGAAPICTPACPPDRPSCVDGQCVVRGPTMILVERLPASDSFYIDSTEVTDRQYLEFVAATNGELGCQPSECAWNTTYAPAPGEVTTVSDLPMHYVDWCDARAYCAWAGKRLCGRIGGGVLPDTSADDYDLSEWLAACGGPNYFWHPSLDASGEPAVACNDWGSSRLKAGSTCEGSYPGLFDLEGNVSEWIDSCTGSAGAADLCEALGGNAISDTPGDSCGVHHPTRRDSRYSLYGFRCCASAG